MTRRALDATRPTNLNTSSVLIVALAVFALVAVLFVGPLIVGVCIAGLAFVVVSLWRPAVPTVVTLFLAFSAMPAEVPREIQVGGFAVHTYQLTLAVAAIAWLVRGRRSKASDLTALCLAIVLVSAAALSVMAGHGVQAVVVDSRHLIFGSVAVFVAGRAWRAGNLRVYYLTLAVTLWLSAGLTVLASVTGLNLGQRQLGASLDLGDSDAAARLITEATYPAVAVITTTLVLYLLGKLPPRAALHLTLPAVIIVVLSFSRNPLLSIALAVPIALLLAPQAATVARVAKLLAVAAILVLIGLAFTAIDPNSAVSTWLANQTAGVVTRVIEGISAQAISLDSSAQYRAVQENPYLLAAIADSPAIGHGFGFSYKPAFTGRYFANPEDAIRASRYAHQFYWWLATKIGIGGLVIFLALTLLPAVRALSRRYPSPAVISGMAAALIGMFAQSFFAPMPIGSPTGVLFGALVGVVAAGARTAQSHRESLAAARVAEDRQATEWR